MSYYERITKCEKELGGYELLLAKLSGKIDCLNLRITKMEEVPDKKPAGKPDAQITDPLAMVGKVVAESRNLQLGWSKIEEIANAVAEQQFQ